MELIILLVVVVGVIGWFLWSEGKHKETGTHPLDGATNLGTSTSNLDVNKDGKVDLEDAKVAVKEVKQKAKQVTKKVKAKVAEVKQKVKKPKTK